MAESEQEKGPEQTPSGSWYDRHDVKTGKVAAVGIVGIILLVIAFYLIDQYFLATTRNQVTQAVLQAPSTELDTLRAQEDSLLNSYKLVDSTKMIYQIPIKRAMEIMAESAGSGGEH